MKKLDIDSEIILENERARLSPLKLAHLPLLKDVALTEKGLLQYSPSDIESEEALKNYIQTSLDDSKRYAFLIFDKQTQEYAGSTSFGNISNKDQRVEIGWTWIGKKFQGTGLNKAMKDLMLSYAFDTLEFERVELKTDDRNEQSKKAIQKIGGKYEGTLRSHTLMLDGHRRDTVYFSILKEEWLQR